MSFGRKKPVAEEVYADTMVWQCTECNCWSRDEYVTGDDPTCPMCKSPMAHEMKNIRVE